jgi:hypothetical protein
MKELHVYHETKIFLRWNVHVLLFLMLLWNHFCLLGKNEKFELKDLQNIM